MSITSINPRTGEVTGVVEETTPAQLEAVLARASAAAGLVAGATPTQRASLLRALADALDARTDELAQLADAETGLGLPRLTGEVGRTSGQLRLFAEVLAEGSWLGVSIDRADPNSTPPRPEIRRVLTALGPALVFAASNFPFAFSILGGDSASALAAGCPVIAKAHDAHPLLSQAIAGLVADVLKATGHPEGVFQVITGLEAGRSAIVDPRVRAAGFTGSTAGGRALFDLAAAREDPIPFFGELGSINPVVVTRDALAERGPAIAQGYLGSLTLGAGQFCTNPGLLLLPQGHGLETLLAAALAEVPPQVMLAERISSAFAAGVSAAEAAGAQEIGAGQSAAGPGFRAQARVASVETGEFIKNSAVLSRECFGPFGLVVTYRDDAELLAALAAVPGALTGSLHLADGDSADTPTYLAALAARVGRVIVNGWPTGVAVSWSQHHSGPWPSSTNSAHTSVGARAIDRWLRPVSYQSVPDALLPVPLQDANPWHLPRRIDGALHLPA